jgi:hemolysin activation/secretion protein
MKQHIAQLIAGTAIVLLSSVPVHAATPPDDGVPHFDITRFDVDGNTLLPQQTVAALLQPFTGSQRDFSDVQRALEALEAAYRARGFSVVQVTLPEQELNGGVVHLQVAEARLGKLRVEGNQSFSGQNIRNSLPGLREGQTPNTAQISSSLKLANENPAKKATLQLQNGEQGDEIDAVVKVHDDKPWRIGASLDNSGNSSTGDTRLTVQYLNANVADRDQVLSLQYTTTVEKPNQVSVYGAGYHIPLYALGDSVDLFASYSDVDAGAVTAGIFNLQVSGKGTVAGARYNHNLRRVGDYESRLVYGFDYKAYQNNVTLQSIQLGNNITVHPVSIAYGGTWTLPNASTDFNVVLLHNIVGGDRGGSADFNRVRSGASAGYSILRVNAGYSRALPKDWQLRFAISGQYSNDMLVPGEQFGTGGAASVRGFDEREIANDRGASASAEIYTPNLCGAVGSLAAQCRALAFYDTAHVARNHPLPGELAQASIGSVGLGFRMAAGNNWTLQLDAARVIDSGLTRTAGDSRVHVKLALSY